jgi:hypothetical protein
MLQLGLILLRKSGPRRYNDIAQRLRQLARIERRIALIKNTNQITMFESFIFGTSFDLVMQAIVEECKPFVNKGGHNLLGKPNLALKVGLSVLKLCKLMLGKSITNTDAVRKPQTEELIALYAFLYGTSAQYGH